MTIARLFLTASALLAIAATAACTGGDAGAPVEDIAPVTAATTPYYDCWESFSQDGTWMQHVEVGYSPAKLEVTDLSVDARPPDSGDIDPSYHPTSDTYKDTTRYLGFASLPPPSGDVASIAFMVSKELQTGAPSGKLWMRDSGPEGGGTRPYDCKAKPAKLAVDTKRNARLACDLDVVSCVHDNPPGDTCLEKLFVNQTESDSATVRFTYLDHLGVAVQSRDEQIGSAPLARTEQTASGTWQNNVLDVTYRAGITYLGTLTLADGRTANVHCNDLAMLDP